MPDGGAVGTSLITVGMNFLLSLHCTHTHTIIGLPPVCPRHLPCTWSSKQDQGGSRFYHREHWKERWRALRPYAFTWPCCCLLLMPEFFLCNPSIYLSRPSLIPSHIICLWLWHCCLLCERLCGLTCVSVSRPHHQGKLCLPRRQ